MPIIVMTPTRNIMNTDKPRRKIHPRWEPYEYKLKDYFVSDEDEQNNIYAAYRKNLIQKEKQFVISQMAKSNPAEEESKYD